MIVSLLLAACAGAADAEPETHTTEPAVGESLTVDPALADDVAAAMDLWSSAAGAVVDFGELRLTLGEIPECADRAGCFSAAERQIDVSMRVSPAKRVSTIAHELGHSLGLPDMPGTGSLMDPDRTGRERPCIDAETVAAAGFDGPGACEGEP